MTTRSAGSAERAREDRAHVRRLLSERQPEFAAVLAAVERDFCGQAESRRQAKRDECRNLLPL